MRVLAGILLVAAIVIQLLLAGGLFLSSRYDKMTALDRAGDLSTVSGDLGLSEEELQRYHQQAEKKAGPAGLLKLVSSIGLGVLALLQVAGVVLLFLRRLRLALLVLQCLAMAALGGLMVLEGPMTAGIIAVALLAAAFVLSVLSRPAAVSGAGQDEPGESGSIPTRS